MIRKLMMIGLVLSFMTTASAATAEKVFVTANGAKYHKEDCRSIKGKDTLTLDKEAAVEEGYTPCRRCYKEDITAEENEAKQAAKKTEKAETKTKKE